MVKRRLTGIDITNVTIVGMVSKKATRNADISFTVDDGTGRIVCKRWINDNFDTIQMDEIQPVTNFDEITFHFIECIATWSCNHSVPIYGFICEYFSAHGSSGYQTAASELSSGQHNVDVSKNCDQLVLNYLQLPSSVGIEKGIHRDELSRQLKIPLEKIQDSIRSLEDEGLIYFKIDEFHYKSAA